MKKTLAVLGIMLSATTANAAPFSVGFEQKWFQGKNMDVESYYGEVKVSPDISVGFSVHEGSELRWDDKKNDEHWMQEGPIYFFEPFVRAHVVGPLSLRAGAGLESINSEFIYSASADVSVPVALGFSVNGSVGYADISYTNGITTSLGIAKEF
jgi:hypothetical protein